MHDAFVHVCQSPAVAIIAAAGNNEVVPLTGHPQSRFPAAFDGVSGVAALAKDDLNPSTPDALASIAGLGPPTAAMGSEPHSCLHQFPWESGTGESPGEREQ